jgi:hypothetical protein
MYYFIVQSKYFNSVEILTLETGRHISFVFYNGEKINQHLCIICKNQEKYRMLPKSDLYFKF